MEKEHAPSIDSSRHPDSQCPSINVGSRVRKSFKKISREPCAVPQLKSFYHEGCDRNGLGRPNPGPGASSTASGLFKQRARSGGLWLASMP